LWRAPRVHTRSLFVLPYINDNPNSIQSVPRLFADDTCLILSHSNLLSLQASLIREVSNIYNWCKANKLTINPNKCNSLIIFPQSNKSITEFPLTLEDSVIETEATAKYLGILIDSKLNFKYHLNFKLNFKYHLNLVESKLSRAVGILYKVKTVLHREALLCS